MWLALLLACGLPHRVVKSLVAPDYATLSTPTGDAVDVSYQADPKGPVAPYAPGVFQSDGRWFAQAVEVTTAGSIDIAPVGDDVGITLWVRSPGLRQQDFVPVRTVSGGLDGQYANRHLVLTGQERMAVKNLMQMIAEMLPGKVKLEYTENPAAGHYVMTPYAFHPKIGHKLVANDYVDIGQGLLDCLAEIHESTQRGQHTEGEWLVVDNENKK